MKIGARVCARELAPVVLEKCCISNVAGSGDGPDLRSKMMDATLKPDLTRSLKLSSTIVGVYRQLSVHCKAAVEARRCDEVCVLHKES